MVEDETLLFSVIKISLNRQDLVILNWAMMGDFSHKVDTQLIPLCFLPPFGISLHLATWVLSLPSVSFWALVFFEGGRRLLRDLPLGLPMLYLKCREGICCLCSSQSHFGFPHQLMVTWRSWTWAGTFLHSWESWLTDWLPFYNLWLDVMAKWAKMAKHENKQSEQGTECVGKPFTSWTLNL